MASVRILEEKKVPNINVQSQTTHVSIPRGLTPEQWLKIREKTVLAGQLFREHQFFLALNVVNEIQTKFLLHDVQLVLIGLWCYLNLGLYCKAESFCEDILKQKNIPGLRRGLLMALHMQGRYDDALSYTTVLSPEEQQEMAKLIQEVQFAYKNKTYPPYICAIGGHTTKLQEWIQRGGNANELYQAPRLGPGTPSLLYLAAANGQNDLVRLLLNLNQSTTSTSTTTSTTSTKTTTTTKNNKNNNNNNNSKSKATDSNIADITFDNIGWTSLHIASYLGYTEVVASLIQAGADIHQKMMGSGSDPLQLAIISNNISTARLLLAAKANLNTPLPITPNLGIVENFLLVPGTTSVRVDALQGPSYWHAAAKCRTEVIQMLIKEKYIKVDQQNPKNRNATLLHFATGRGIIGDRCDLKTVEMLINNNANVNIPTESGYTPLHFACRCADEDTLPVVRALIGAKADLNAITRFNETPLVCALSAGNAPVVKELVCAGADLAKTEKEIKQPIIPWCVLSGSTYLVKSILEGLYIRFSKELGLDFDDVNSKQLNPFSRQLKDSEIANPEQETTTTTTATTTTTSTTTTSTTTPDNNNNNNNIDDLELRKQRRLELLAQVVNARTNKLGMAALHWCCLKGDWVSVGFLLKWGADPLLECEYQNLVVTPLKCCSMYNIGKQMEAEMDDMADCAVLIKERIDVLEGRIPAKPIIHDFDLKDDLDKREQHEEMIRRREEQQELDQRNTDEYYDDMEAEGEWVDAEGEDWYFDAEGDWDLGDFNLDDDEAEQPPNTKKQ